MARSERVAVAIVAHIGATICSRSHQCRFVPARKFRAFFGVSVHIATDFWPLIPYRSDDKIKYLVWALMFLKIFDTEQVHAMLTGCDGKSLRKWYKEYVELLSNIPTVRLAYKFLILLTNREQIFWDYRKIGRDLFGCHVSVDGISYAKQEPQFFDRKRDSNKIMGAGKRLKSEFLLTL